MSTGDVLLSPKQTAERLQLTVHTLQRMRTEGDGPKFCIVGRRRIAYSEAAIAEYVARRTASSTSDARARGLVSSLSILGA
jgi:predicted DNA-binding transcriptional regulator AlpA